MKKNYFLLRGIAVLLFSFLLFTNLSAQLYINEFMASNDSALPGPQGDYPDWIEIYNAGTEAVMLGGYSLCDTLDATQAYQIPDTSPDSVTVQPGGFILFYANKDEELSVLNVDFKLSGDGEQVGLWNPEQVLLDGITYGEQFADTSYGRYADGTDNWFMMSDFTPGESNVNPNIGPTDIDLYINEFMASNDSALPGPQGDFPDWIEIYNAGTEAVMLGGYSLCDTLDATQAYQIPDTSPDSVTVQPGGFILFYANKDEELSVLNVDFKLSGDGEQVGLWNPEQVLLDGITYGEQFADTSYGRYADGTDNWFMMPDFTPGASNIYTSSIGEVIENVSISQNYPNPFSTKTNIQFELDNADKVVVKVYDMRGSLITILADGNFQAGTHTVIWNANDAPAGYYFYSLQTSTSTVTKKASIIR
jgi:hypothetical protein